MATDLMAEMLPLLVGSLQRITADLDLQVAAIGGPISLQWSRIKLMNIDAAMLV